MSRNLSRWIKYLIAVVGGNILYLYIAPLLPPRARHHRLIDWGTFVDLWICLFIYGLIELLIYVFHRNRTVE